MCQGFSLFPDFSHHFILANLATGSSIRVRTWIELHIDVQLSLQYFGVGSCMDCL